MPSQGIPLARSEQRFQEDELNINTDPNLDANDSGDNNIPTPPGFANHPRDQILHDSGWLCGFRVDDMDRPQVSALKVASYRYGTTPFIQEMNNVSTEIVTTRNQRAANYVHQGWSVGAVETISPWTSSRIDAANRHNAEGTWITRKTLVARLRVQVLLRDLIPRPEFVAAVEEALKLPTRFEKFQAVYDALSRWGDVVPLEMELGSSLTLTDTEANFARLPVTNSYNSLAHLLTIKTANIVRKGPANNLGWDNGTWTATDVPALEWQPIRITAVAPTFHLLASNVQAGLIELYDELLSYIPPLATHPIGWLHKIYDDTDNASKTISKLEIHFTDNIIGLSVHYLDGVVSQAGREAGNVHMFKLTKGEHIVEMLTCADGEWLRGLQFVTNKGRCSVIYGTLEGIPIISRSKGAVLAGFSIISKQHSQWDHLITSARGIWRYDLIPRVLKENDVYSDYFGAITQYGTGFNDRVLIGNSSSMYISTVEVRSGSAIDSIQFTYTDTRNSQNDKIKTAHHGGPGGSLHQFELGHREYIVSISGRYNERCLTQLCFGTNIGRTSEIYGAASGHEFSARAPSSKNGSHLRLQYILGKSDDRLNGVVFVWTPDLL